MNGMPFPPYYGTDAIHCGDNPSGWAAELSAKLGLKVVEDEQFKVKRIETMLVGLSSICQLDCPFCTGHYSPTRNLLPKSELDIDRLVDQVRSHRLETGFNVGTLSLGCTGEVLIHPQISRVIRETQDAVDQFDMLTNLSIGNQKLIESIAGHPQFKNITISCDAGDAETYPRYRVGGDFEKVVKNARILAGGGKRLFMRSIVYKENEDSLRRLPELLGGIGFQGLHLVYTYDSPERLSEIGLSKHTYEEFKAFFVEMLSRCDGTGVQLSTDPAFYIPDMVGVIPGFETQEALASYSSAPCDNLYRVTITPDGNYFHCCHMESRGYFSDKPKAAFYGASLGRIFDNPVILAHRKLQLLGYFPRVCKSFCSKVDKPRKEREALLLHSLKHPHVNRVFSLEEFVSMIVRRPKSLIIRALSPAVRNVLAAHPALLGKVSLFIDQNPDQPAFGKKISTSVDFDRTDSGGDGVVLIASDRATVFDSVLNSFDHFEEIYKLHFFEKEMKDFKVQQLYPLPGSCTS